MLPVKRRRPFWSLRLCRVPIKPILAVLACHKALLRPESPCHRNIVYF